ncbi:hypothetical protein CLUG_03233 [Clavispora lusitaniae ATCC 42720]|uniref:Sodium/calcium exchanger membrane region domain-containing protein n=1 Tax=Clavispora lusitaniae (strain ATCC 42720) TaxID=306902 RepID=C4Y4Z9_CLAL4|nr:uncharacterized protein CLUG_03233 [Clavispora lusitaniae ATCC 42720]EEQ39105.1 hypothetical protein CLUG_03233 [Clavispora lusitaniae ATCC 42720]
MVFSSRTNFVILQSGPLNHNLVEPPFFTVILRALSVLHFLSFFFGFLNSLSFPSFFSSCHLHYPCSMKLSILLLLTTALAHAANTTLTCSDIHLIPSDQQCAFARYHCSSPDFHIGVFNYVDWHYCSPIRQLSVPLALTSLLISFVSLGTTASDYLCPNLYSISKFLSLSDNLAGLTLLAVGNGSADVLSTYKALSVGSAGLAVSELVGAALFILTIVVGSICVVHPFKVPKQHFLRDSAFYLLVTFILFIALASGGVSIFASVSLMLVYVLYVLVAIYSHSWLETSARKKVQAARIRSNYDQEAGLDLASEYPDNLSSLPSIDVLAATEEENNEASEEFDRFLSNYPHNPAEERVPIQTGSYGLHVLLRELGKHSSRSVSAPSASPIRLVVDRPLTAPTNKSGPQEETEEAESDRERQPEPESEQQEEPEVDESYLEERHDNAGSFPFFLLPAFTAGSSLSTILQIVSYPANIVLKLTTPNREMAIEYGEHSASFSNAFTYQPSGSQPDDQFSDYDYQADTKIFKVQLPSATLFVAFLYFYSVAYFWFYMPVALAFAIALGQAFPSDVPRFETHMLRYRAINYVGSFVGFVLSVSWISIFATEIVAVLKALSLIFSMSETILGVTVFAFGNSIGDFVSNLTIANMGMPVMAFGACFGGPLLSLCSLGLSSLLNMPVEGKLRVEFTTTLKLNLLALFFTLVFIVVAVPRNGWKFDRAMGVCLISIWAVAVSVSILLEVV